MASDYDLASVFKDLNFKGSSVVGSLISSSIGLASAGTTMASSALRKSGATDKLFGSTQLVGGFQDDILNPILIILIYDKYKNLIFPINPEEFTINTPSNSQIVKIHNLGDRSIPQRRGLSTFSINSFFWAERNWFVPPQGAIEWLETWRDSGKPAHLIVTKLNYSYKVTCENLKYTTKAGEENDIYFTLDLKEFRPYKIKLKSVEKILPKEKPVKQTTSESVSQTQSPLTVKSDVSEPKKEKITPTVKVEKQPAEKARFSNSDFTTRDGNVVITKEIENSYDLLKDVNSKVDPNQSYSDLFKLKKVRRNTDASLNGIHYYRNVCDELEKTFNKNSTTIWYLKGDGTRIEHVIEFDMLSKSIKDVNYSDKKQGAQKIINDLMNYARNSEIYK